MTIALDHMSVPTRDKVATAEFYAQLFGVHYEGPRRDYAPVIVNEGLTLNFEHSEMLDVRHYAFRVAPEEFQALMQRLSAASVPFGSSTRTKEGEVYERDGVRGFFFEDPNGHSVEILTRD